MPRILRLFAFTLTAIAAVLLVYCLTARNDLLAAYWGAVVVLGFRFNLAPVEAD